MTAPNRRWFQFSLRAFFISATIITVIGYWLGSNILIVRQRQAMRERGDVMFGTGSAETNERILRVAKPTAKLSISPIRRMLGDEPAEVVLVLDDATFEQVAPLFPEATVAIFNPPEGWPLR